VFGLDGSGDFIGTSPELIQDNSSLTGHLWVSYLQDEWQLSKQLTLNYGARYDSVNTVVSEQQLSPRLGVVYDVSKDTRLHAG
ncbi:TonB-dependent receptor domain-containing protein, partial [Vibrio vulnificus]|uniref:TonB-dependent receptor domain-containing protein n=1 Tax=Vibrio vulnificus TaxID=672 RepID=UPI00188B1F74